jgi:hypothetical protein
MNEDGPGFRTELLIAEAMKNQGWRLAHAPVIDRRSSRDDVAPMIQGDRNETIMPDILAMCRGRTVWVEVKYKATGAEFIIKNNQNEHFIDRDNWDDYNEVKRRGDCQVWLVILEGDTNTLQRQRINEVSVVGYWNETDVEEKNGTVYGNPGVFVPQSDFEAVDIQAGFAPENFFGQDRLSVEQFDERVLPVERESDAEETTEEVQSKNQRGLGDFATDGGADNE